MEALVFTWIVVFPKILLYCLLIQRNKEKSGSALCQRQENGQLKLLAFPSYGKWGLYIPPLSFQRIYIVKTAQSYP